MLPLVPFPSYVAGFDTGSPREYLTLVSGRGSNFAEIYDKQGMLIKYVEKKVCWLNLWKTIKSVKKQGVLIKYVKNKVC